MRNRTFHMIAAVMVAVLLLFAAGNAAAQTKNVILLIGDGFGPTQFSAAWLYSNRVLGKELHMVELMKMGRTAYMVNDTADAIVTESAAAASQIATGQRMTVRAISMADDNKTPVKTILEMVKERKYATGLVTTSGITDATPAAFVAHVSHRSNEVEVAAQEIASGVDVLMGGRKQFFLPDKVPAGKRKDGRDLMEEARKAGYTVVGTASELQAASGPKILGLFNMVNMTYEIDRAATQEPSLADMTAKTLQVLAKNGTGFFVVIEGGRIDHAAHRNDAAGTIRETLAFDDAVGVAMEFARKNPDTLLIVTADHETGGMALIGHSKTSTEYVGIDLKAIERVTASHEVIAAKLGRRPTPSRVKEVVKEYYGIELTDAEASTVSEDTVKKLDPDNYTYDYLHSLAFVLRPYLRVGWGTSTHTASPLFLFGAGPGAENISGFMHNTEVFTVMKAALKLK